MDPSGRPVSRCQWAALDVLASNDPMPTVVTTRPTDRTIRHATAVALQNRGLVDVTTSPHVGMLAALTEAGRRALSVHERIEAAHHVAA